MSRWLATCRSSRQGGRGSTACGWLPRGDWRDLGTPPPTHSTGSLSANVACFSSEWKLQILLLLKHTDVGQNFSLSQQAKKNTSLFVMTQTFWSHFKNEKNVYRDFLFYHKVALYSTVESLYKTIMVTHGTGRK